MRALPGRWMIPLVAVLAIAGSVAVTGMAHAQEIQVALSSCARISATPILSGGSMTNDLKMLYRKTGTDRLWTGRAGLNRRGLVLLAALEDADAHGLDPERYDMTRIRSLLSLRSGQTSGALDRLMSRALLLYIADMTCGRFAPDEIDSLVKYERPVASPLIVALAVLRAPDFSARIMALVPAHPAYLSLQAALVAMRKTPPWQDVDFEIFGGAIEKGLRDRRIPRVRRRLAAEDPFLLSNASEIELYDDDLAAAVRRFQGRHALPVDGVIGRHTLRALAVSHAERINQIKANLDRWRWLPRSLGSRHVLVNLPAFRLYAVSNGRVDLDLAIIAGTPWRRTPLFVTLISETIFNPTWSVPPTIALNDLLPRIRSEADFFEAENMALFENWNADAARLDPAMIDWSMPDRDILKYKLMKYPGPQNPLGTVKFDMPNQWSIYLHDTDKPEKFVSALRAMSSGCIRVENASSLADFLLAPIDGWSAAKRRLMVARGQTRAVAVPGYVPIYLIYQTVTVAPDGAVIFHPDIYRLDAKYRRRLIELAHETELAEDTP
ncbi:MAG: L,D-transpeptidase family protein [Pseudomonadota bacterium]|nr:L,D-transpeptidase family protein [Pseudomonadota bacterium]